MRSAAEILPDYVARLAVDVVVDRQFARAHLDGSAVVVAGRALQPDELELVRLVRHRGAGLILRSYPADEQLVRVDDLQHHLLKLLQLVGREGFLDVEVEVEAVGDVGTDPQLGVRPQLLDGLCHHMGGGMAQHLESGR